jgi:hypothetical protein
MSLYDFFLLTCGFILGVGFLIVVSLLQIKLSKHD